MTDSHYDFKKRVKGNIFHNVFTAVEIRTQEPGSETQTLFFFLFSGKLLFMIPVSFSQKQTANQHIKGT